MTLNEFLEELSNVQGRWFLNTMDEIRCRINGYGYCPVTAVYFAITGETIPTYNFVYAGGLLNMEGPIVRSIAYAADFDSETSLRPKILAATGLVNPSLRSG